MSFRPQRARRMLRFADRLRERDSSHRRLSPPGGGTGLLSGPRRSTHRRPLAAEPGAGPASHGGPQRLADGGPGLDCAGGWLWFWKRWDEVFFLFKKLFVLNFPSLPSLFLFSRIQRHNIYFRQQNSNTIKRSKSNANERRKIDTIMIRL